MFEVQLDPTSVFTVEFGHEQTLETSEVVLYAGGFITQAVQMSQVMVYLVHVGWQMLEDSHMRVGRCACRRVSNLRLVHTWYTWSQKAFQGLGNLLLCGFDFDIHLVVCLFLVQTYRLNCRRRGLYQSIACMSITICHRFLETSYTIQRSFLPRCHTFPPTGTVPVIC